MDVLRGSHTKLQPDKYCSVILADTASCQNMVLLQNGKIKYPYNFGCAKLLFLRRLGKKASIMVYTFFFRQDSKFIWW